MQSHTKCAPRFQSAPRNCPVEYGHYYYFDFGLSRIVGGMAAEHGVVNELIVGHSFVRRFANYALLAGEMNIIGVNHPAIVREIPHFYVFPAFPHFSQNVPHVWLYFEKLIFLQIVIMFGARKEFRNGSFTVKDFRLYDETGSSKAPFIFVETRARLADEFIASWLLLAAKVTKMLARPARRRITYEVVDEVFDNNPNYHMQ